MWDEEDRERDSRRLERGEGLLELGHETPATTVQDARAGRDPRDAAALGLAAGGRADAGRRVRDAAVMHHYWIALGFLVAGGLALLGWHRTGVSA